MAQLFRIVFEGAFRLEIDVAKVMARVPAMLAYPTEQEHFPPGAFRVGASQLFHLMHVVSSGCIVCGDEKKMRLAPREIVKMPRCSDYTVPKTRSGV